ncbi:Cof-type HAD-IIB family hydrolase [Convivina intestini]|uniref:Cof-type HAD-IIB family hydrolase n=1 Tax=Convivina intestini TaxID=1505726 RepID=UPI00200FC0AF|nr:Cof-type HAD-IIB family hydrolase [Convivina intestini]CAH1853001.1 Sugar phosphatase YidA [Convivina intestini]
MSAIKLIALDMDNTLLLPDKTLSNQNQKVLTALQKKGIKIVLTTGRPFPNVKPFIEPLNLVHDDFVILFNGSLILDLAAQEPLFNQPFYLDELSSILNLIHNLNLPVDLISQDQVYAIKEYGQSAYIDFVGNRIDYSLTALDEIPAGTTFNKFVVCADESQLDYLEDVLAKTPILTKNLNMMRSRRTLLEFMPKGVDKGNALKYLLHHLGLTPANLMAFGDEENDRSMLELAHVSVAMDNAIPSIKAITTNVTSSNADDGVAQFLTKYFKL